MHGRVYLKYVIASGMPRPRTGRVRRVHMQSRVHKPEVERNHKYLLLGDVPRKRVASAPLRLRI